MPDGHSFLTEKEEVLKILREITANPGLTQRQMSVLLGVSLGKINFLLKALIEKGFIKAHNFRNADNKTAYLYLLTPRGVEEKTRITYYFLKQKTEEYDRLKKEIRQLQAEVELRERSADEL